MKISKALIKDDRQLQKGFVAALLISLAMTFFSCSGPKEMLKGDQHLRSFLGQSNNGRIKSTILSISDSSIQIMYVNTSADSVGVKTFIDLAFFKSCSSDSLLFQPEKKVSNKGFIMVGGFGYRRMYREPAGTGFPKFNLIAPGDSLKVTTSLKQKIDSKTLSGLNFQFVQVSSFKDKRVSKELPDKVERIVLIEDTLFTECYHHELD